MFRTFTLAASLIALSAGAACAQVTVESWAAAPTAADLAAVFPEKAKAEGVGGGVELVCTVARSGSLNDCQPMAETPRNYGFAAAARKVSGKLRPAGVAPGTEVRVPVTFAAELGRGQPSTAKTPSWTALPSVLEMQAAVPKTEGGRTTCASPWSVTSRRAGRSPAASSTARSRRGRGSARPSWPWRPSSGPR